MTATLDQQLLDLADIHGLKSISITAYNADHGQFVGVNIQTDGAIGSCLGGGLSIVDCFKAALLDLHAKQGLSVRDFAPLEVAA